ncbi:unnamed protein product [Didymodactylos carnosus]|uniref:ParB/Sulfiredoxin domain-containing protein n=1 Tax=Didymodactylos carnosus TaxID=1234261 RepID=A0A814TQI0_9BILA|nr:unnamed protein product [Didymodactylos carnosus]CAF3927054.1 unnamed protein product [Didymodactylos carnosus]
MQKNVRLGTGYSSQTEVLNDLFANEDAMQIVETIAQNGYFPDEPPVVVKELGKLVVLEGNRRVASLKAMHTPSIAPKRYAGRIKKLMTNRIPIDSVWVHVATSRDEAMEYLAAKHTKTTRKPWTALRRAYFYYAQKESGQSIDQLIQRYKGVDIPSYIKMHEMHNVAISLKHISEETRKKVSNKGTFTISTLERFYSDNHIQNTLGINFNKTTGEATIPATDDFDKVYSRVVTDIASGIATSRKQLAKEKQRKTYIDSVINEVLDGRDLNKKSKKAAASFKPTNSIKHSQKGLIPKHFEDTLNAPGVGRVMWELQTIDYAKFPNATADLLRTFLEITLKKYLEETNSLPSRKPGSFIFLANVLQKLKTDLQAVSNHGLVQVINEVQNNKWYLDSINHNPDIFAVESRVKDAWDQIQPLIKFVFDDYRNRTTKSKG